MTCSYDWHLMKEDFRLIKIMIRIVISKMILLFPVLEMRRRRKLGSQEQAVGPSSPMMRKLPSLPLMSSRTPFVPVVRSPHPSPMIVFMRKTVTLIIIMVIIQMIMRIKNIGISPVSFWMIEGHHRHHRWARWTGGEEHLHPHYQCHRWLQPLQPSKPCSRRNLWISLSLSISGGRSRSFLEFWLHPTTIIRISIWIIQSVWIRISVTAAGIVKIIVKTTTITISFWMNMRIKRMIKSWRRKPTELSW